MAEDRGSPSSSLKRPWSRHQGSSAARDSLETTSTLDVDYGNAKRSKEASTEERMATEVELFGGRLSCFGPDADGKVTCEPTANHRAQGSDHALNKLTNGHHPTRELSKKDCNSPGCALSELDSTSELIAVNGCHDVNEALTCRGDIPSEDDHDCRPRDISGSPCDQSDDDDDNVSEISELSGLSIEGWRPVAGPISWVQRQMEMGVDPNLVLRQLLSHDTVIPDDLDHFTLWKIVINILSEPPKRKKLKHINTLEDVVHLLKTCKKVMVLTGAGVSVSCGIPDFRSKDGIYSRLAVEYPDLPDPQAMFDIQYFKRNPYPFFKFAKEIYPGQFQPSSSHRFIKLLEQHGSLLRNYTQNIDTLEQVAGITNVIQCHGSFASATCMTCKHKARAEDIRNDIMNQVIPRCPHCPVDEPLAIMKPDIVFFGESLPNEFHNQMEIDKDECDLLIVIGSSLKVRPVALIPNSLPASVPQVLINRESLRHLSFDVELLGDGDTIVSELCHRLGEGWTSLCTTPGPAREMSRDEMSTPPASTHQSPMSTHGQSDDNSGMSFENNCPTSLRRTPSDTSVSNMSVTQEEGSAGSQSQGCRPTKLQTLAPTSSTELPQETPASDSQSGSESCVGMDMQQGSSEGESTQDTYHSCVSTPSHSQRGSVAKSSPAPPNSPASSPAGGHDNSSDNTQQMNKCNSIKDSEITSPDILQELRACWQPRRFNLAARLKENRYLFLPPSRYVFTGAEVYDDDERDSDDNSSQESDSNDEQDLDRDPDHLDLDENAQTGDLSCSNHGNSSHGDELNEAGAAQSASTTCGFSAVENGWAKKNESDESSLSL